AYGRMSEGMICSAAELGLGDDHSGILVLPDDAPLGQDFTDWAGLRDWVLDLSVTPDRGYALSIRGVARDLALAYDAGYTDPDSTDLVIEAAHFSMEGTARMSRRHRLFSEASARFERGVDRELPLLASARAVSLLSALGGGTVVPGCTHAQVDVPPVTIGMTASYPDQVAGVVYGLDAVTRRLRQVGCEVHAETAEAGAAGGPADPDGP